MTGEAPHALCANCLACGSIVSDIVRGWVRNQERRDDPRVWFLCGACLNREPFLRWTAQGPSLRFYGRDRRYVSPDQAETRELLNERLSVGD